MSDERAYLFTTDTTQEAFSSLLSLIDETRAVSNWLKILPGSAVLVSRLDIDDLHEELKAIFPNQRNILVELEKGKKNGWLPRKAWDFMNQPTPA